VTFYIILADQALLTCRLLEDAWDKIAADDKLTAPFLVTTPNLAVLCFDILVKAWIFVEPFSCSARLAGHNTVA
jgi:hypothetical protein